MRNNTQRIYERLSQGEFLSVDSTDTAIRHLYEDIEENVEDYADYFKEIGLRLESGNGYFYFFTNRRGQANGRAETGQLFKMAGLSGLPEVLQPVVYSRIPIPQKPFDGTGQSGY